MIQVNRLYFGIDVGAGAIVTRPKTTRGRVRINGSPSAVSIFYNDMLVSCEEHCCPFEAAMKMDWLERVDAASEWISMHVASVLSGMRAANPKLFGPDLEAVVAYERPPFMNSASVFHVLSFASGVHTLTVRHAVALAIPELAALPRVIPITPTQGKLALCGNGHAKKDDMIRCLWDQFKVTKSEHAADSAGIALAARAEMKNIAGY